MEPPDIARKPDGIKSKIVENGQKSSKKAKKNYNKISFRKPLTFFIIALNIMVVAFGEPCLDIKP